MPAILQNNRLTIWYMYMSLYFRNEKWYLSLLISEWTQEYEKSIVDVNEMQAEIDSFMVQFDENMEEVLLLIVSVFLNVVWNIR